VYVREFAPSPMVERLAIIRRDSSGGYRALVADQLDAE
jgi:hypothetical protein